MWEGSMAGYDKGVARCCALLRREDQAGHTENHWRMTARESANKRENVCVCVCVRERESE